MSTRESNSAEALQATTEGRPVFAVLPGVGIGPFRLGMSEEDIDGLCRQFALRNEGTFNSGLYVAFHEGRATQIEMTVDMGLSLAGEPLTDRNNENVRRLLTKIAPLGPDWTEMEGLVVLHWDRQTDPVFAFKVYKPGHR